MSATAALAVFVSPHGFGHAARACAVMEAIRQKNPAIRFEIFTSVSEAFFRESLGPGAFGYHRLVTDVGLVQQTPFVADIPATAAALNRFFSFATEQTPLLADRLKRLGCAAVLCDISPLGIAAALKARIPSVLVENFTWDWIYEGYVDRYPQMGPPGAALQQAFARADVRIQTEPVCNPAPADLTVGPVSRKIRTSRRQVRATLGVAADRPIVLISLGGIASRPAYVDRLTMRGDLFFVIANAGFSGRLAANVLGLETFSGVYHPDLVGAADALVGKAGYSTVAEVFQAGIPFAHLARSDFKESAVLVEFIQSRIGGVALDPDRFDDGGWLGQIDALLHLPRLPKQDGAAGRIAADLLARFFCPVGG